MVANMFRRDANFHMMKAIIWCLLLALMITCVVINIINGATWAIALCLFACSLDGFNAFMAFKMWWECRQTWKMLEREQKNIEAN